jgi:hypothetical protein
MREANLKAEIIVGRKKRNNLAAHVVKIADYLIDTGVLEHSKRVAYERQSGAAHKRFGQR